MRFLFLLVLALPSVSSSAAAPLVRSDRAGAFASTADCTAHSRIRMAERPSRSTRVTRLGDEPEGALALTVHREVGGCPEPAIVRTGIGSRP